ncbi:MAG TPA: Rrf2 family transcriptional regulator, partial [Candidatus Dormibacteraeota bacterium]|nr:Rrf2 family transcriptional regulator [Candidatus Dormibacteraeota bacterium]
MRFSTRSEYGIRVMVRLGRQYGNGPVPLSELAQEEGLPAAYLEQIAGQLRRTGLVSSRMGARGG